MKGRRILVLIRSWKLAMLLLFILFLFIQHGSSNRTTTSGPGRSSTSTANTREDMHNAYCWLGLTILAAQEYINNGIINVDSLKVMSHEYLNRLIKQIYQNNRNTFSYNSDLKNIFKQLAFWAITCTFLPLSLNL